MIIQITIKETNVIIKVQLPPNAATLSAIFYPDVSSASISSRIVPERMELFLIASITSAPII